MNTKWCSVRQTCKSLNFSRRKRSVACFLTAIGPVITKIADRKTIMNYHTRGQTRKNYHRLSWRIWTSSNWMIVDESEWYCMIVGGQTEARAKTIIDYHRLSWAVWPGLYKLRERHSWVVFKIRRFQNNKRKHVCKWTLIILSASLLLAHDLRTSGNFRSLSFHRTKFPRSTSSTRAISSSVLSAIILSLQTFFSRVLLLRQRAFYPEIFPQRDRRQQLRR